ncbi:aminotransferase class V-fold PLP-dependent enzyme [Laceyella putida]|uniref:Aminotransferase class V-fold PLP-dependent enzyme n=1 Tax=Laceyella putida TaxID=110101 RepID=A0ABW2RMF5_9BACL
MSTQWPRFQDLCPQLGASLYLNTGTCAPLLDPIHEAIAQANHFLQYPSAKPWLFTENACTQVRLKLAALLRAHPDEIVLTENGTFGLNTVIAGIPWREGDEIIITSHEHVSSLIPCFSIAKRYHLKVTILHLHGKTDEAVIGELLQLINKRTRLIIMSHITWNTGRILPVAEICQLARAHQVFTLIDGVQGAGQIEVDVKAIGCDAYALSGHKWLLGPTGTGACYVSASLLEQLWPLASGYCSITGFSLDGEIDWKTNSEKLEYSTKNTALYTGLGRSLELLEQYQLPAITSHIHCLATWFKEQLQLLSGVTLFTDLTFPTSGLVSCHIDGVSYEAVLEHCHKQRLYIRYLPRPEGIRFSIHAFNSQEELIRALMIFEEAIAYGRKLGQAGSSSVLIATHRE